MLIVNNWFLKSRRPLCFWRHCYGRAVANEASSEIGLEWPLEYRNIPLNWRSRAI